MLLVCRLGWGKGIGSADRTVLGVWPAAIARGLRTAAQDARPRPTALLNRQSPACACAVGPGVLPIGMERGSSLILSLHQRMEASRLKPPAAARRCASAVEVVRRARDLHGSRAMSSGGDAKEQKVKHEGEPMFLSLPGSVDAHTVKVNKDKRLIVGLENTMKLLSTEIGKEVPGVVSTLNDNGLPEIRWSPAQTEGVLAYLKAHEFSAIEASYKYEGAFASGVKKVKVLSLFSLIFTSVGGPLLVIGDGAATAMQWGMAGAVVFFGVSTTGLLHMITSPYVLSLRRLADGSFEAVKPVITGGECISRFRAEDVRASSMPFETFKAQGAGGSLQGYYIHKELFLGDEGQEMLCALLGVEAAEDMYEKQLAENPNDLDTLYNYGRFLWKVQKDLPAAEGAFVRVLEEDPNDDDAKQALVELGRELAAEEKPQ